MMPHFKRTIMHRPAFEGLYRERVEYGIWIEYSDSFVQNIKFEQTKIFDRIQRENDEGTKGPHNIF